MNDSSMNGLDRLSQGTENPNEYKLEKIKGKDQLDSLKGQMAHLGYDPRIESQSHADTAGLEHEIDKLFTECSRPENHKSMHVLMKGGRVEGYIVVHAPSGEKHIEIDDIRLPSSNTGEQYKLEDLFPIVRADIMEKMDPPRTRAFIMLEQGQTISKNLERATDQTIIRERFEFKEKDGPKAANDNDNKAREASVEKKIA